MTEIRALIVDDEPLARRGIRQFLARHRDVTIVGECRDGREALRALETTAPSLVFLDVQMPELDGFAVVREFGPQRMPLVVFVTAYDEFAVRAFEAHALDYLVKPLSAERFNATMNRVRERLRVDEAAALATRLSDLLDGAARDKGAEERIVISTNAGDLVINAGEIDWIEADDYYAAVHVAGRRHLLRESLASLEQRLDPAAFVRVHRSALVRIDRIRAVRPTPSGETIVVLRDGTTVPVSRRRREALHASLRGARS